jgi:hypothetical protein
MFCSVVGPVCSCVQTTHVRLSALILPYFSTLKGIFCPGQRDFLPYTKIICSHIYPISLLYTNHYNFYFQFNIPPSLSFRSSSPICLSQRYLFSHPLLPLSQAGACVLRASSSRLGAARAPPLRSPARRRAHPATPAWIWSKEALRWPRPPRRFGLLLFLPASSPAAPSPRLVASHRIQLASLGSATPMVAPRLVPWLEMEPLATCTKEKKIG